MEDKKEPIKRKTRRRPEPETVAGLRRQRIVLFIKDTRTMLDFTALSTADLVRVYNECAAHFGKPPVTRFSDRKTAEARTRLALSQIVDVSKRPAPFNEPSPAADPAPKAKKTHHPAIVNVSFTPTKPPEDIVVAPGASSAPVAADPVPEAAPPAEAAPKPAPKAKKPVEAPPTFNGLSFGPVRVGTFREKVIAILAAHRNEMVPIDDIIAAAYGEPDVEKTIAIGRVLDGVAMMIGAAKTPVELRRTKKGSGLFDLS